MKGNNLHIIRKSWIIACAGLAVLAMVFAFLPRTEVQAAPVQTVITSPQSQLPDATCLGCHGKPGVTTTLPGGEELTISIDPNLFIVSVHGSQEMGLFHLPSRYYRVSSSRIDCRNPQEFSFEATQGPANNVMPGPV